MSELHSQQWSLTRKVDKKAADVDGTVDQQTQQGYTVYSFQKKQKRGAFKWTENVLQGHSTALNNARRLASFSVVSDNTTKPVSNRIVEKSHTDTESKRHAVKTNGQKRNQKGSFKMHWKPWKWLSWQQLRAGTRGLTEAIRGMFTAPNGWFREVRP